MAIHEMSEYLPPQKTSHKTSEKKDYSFLVGLMIGAIATGMGLYALASSLSGLLGPEIHQENVLGSPYKAEIYIKRDGVKYFSHVDGKEITDLIEEQP